MQCCGTSALNKIDREEELEVGSRLACVERVALYPHPRHSDVVSLIHADFQASFLSPFRITSFERVMSRNMIQRREALMQDSISSGGKKRILFSFHGTSRASASLIKDHGFKSGYASGNVWSTPSARKAFGYCKAQKAVVFCQVLVDSNPQVDYRDFGVLRQQIFVVHQNFIVPVMILHIE